MTARLRQLELRQRALVLRSDLQRRAIADEGLAIGARLDGVERKVALGRQLLSWPALGAGVLALLAFAGPRRALRLASRALVFATLARRRRRPRRNGRRRPDRRDVSRRRRERLSARAPVSRLCRNRRPSCPAATRGADARLCRWPARPWPEA